MKSLIKRTILFISCLIIICVHFVCRHLSTAGITRARHAQFDKLSSLFKFVNRWRVLFQKLLLYKSLMKFLNWLSTFHGVKLPARGTIYNTLTCQSSFNPQEPHRVIWLQLEWLPFELFMTAAGKTIAPIGGKESRVSHWLASYRPQCFYISFTKNCTAFIILHYG